jgi:hypothetical protein
VNGPKAAQDNAPEPKEFFILAIECEETPPWHLVNGCSRDTILAFADDLNRRLVGVIAIEGVSRRFPPVEVIATEKEKVDPPIVDAGFYRRRMPWWLMWHLSGIVGLATLKGATAETGDWDTPETRWLLVAGWCLEILLIGLTINMGRESPPPK